MFKILSHNKKTLLGSSSWWTHSFVFPSPSLNLRPLTLSLTFGGHVTLKLFKENHLRDNPFSVLPLPTLIRPLGSCVPSLVPDSSRP